VAYPRINPHMAMAMALAGKKKNVFLRELRHKGDCYCFEWTVYCVCPMACYMDIRALYTTKPPKCALSCQGDLAADHCMTMTMAMDMKVDIILKVTVLVGPTSTMVITQSHCP
jgi:hypothetical protein